MSTYFVTANYTSSAMKGMMENPHNRKEAINGLLEKMDITLDCFNVSATGHIFMVITGSNVNVGAMALVVGSTGSVESNFRSGSFRSRRARRMDEAGRIDHRSMQTSKLLTNQHLNYSKPRFG